MAENNKNSKPQTQATEKKMTKYDLKVQRRKEMKAKKKKEKMAFRIGCVVVLVVIVALIAGKCISNYQTKNGAYFKVGDHSIKKEEFDYYTNTAYSSFIQNYGQYAQYFGLDTNTPLDQQNYSDTLTWKDYFEQQAVDQLKNVYALCDEAKAQNFTSDPTARVEEFEKSLAEQVAQTEMSESEFLKMSYGEYANKKDIEGYIANNLLANDYYNAIKNSVEVTEDDIQSYYDEHKDDYDIVDYLICKIAADMPEEEAAEETEETAETLSEEEQAAKDAETEAAKAAALSEAQAKADEMCAEITDEISFAGLFAQYTTDDPASTEYQKTGDKKSAIFPSVVADWLFDAARQPGDKAVVPYETGNSFYVVYFKNRSLADQKVVDVRHILISAETTEDMTEDEIAAAKAEAKAKADEVYAEWKAGEATEESFAALAEVYSTDGGSNKSGGLYEGVTKGQMVESFDNWIFDESRKYGDTDIVETEYGYHIMFFVDGDQTEWHSSIKSTLVNEQTEAQVDALEANYEVSDPKGHLYFLKAEAEAAAAAETAAAAESGESVAAEETTVETTETEAN